MQENRTQYPSYNVLEEKEHWDEHTREIVLKRTGPFEKPKFLQEHEAELLRAIARHIVYDDREEILAYVVHQLDQHLASPVGEDQRKVGIPTRETLLRRGLIYLDQLAEKEYGSPFVAVSNAEQLALLNDVDKGRGVHLVQGHAIPQKEFFKKMATEMVSAYYSHPQVWSEIGYGGPAYPRGYVRSEKGLTDPWEAKRDGNE